VYLHKEAEGQMSVPSANDIHAVLVQSAIDREDTLATAGENAAKVDVAALVAQAVEDKDAEGLVSALMRAAAFASALDLDAQSESAKRQVDREVAPLKRTPAEQVPAVKNEDIAAARAEKMTR
jgi:hypothetical protein